jgi:hypothetical protein
VTKEYKDIKEIERDLKIWIQFRDYMMTHQQSYHPKVWDEAMAEANTKVTFLKAALSQRKYNDGQ